MKKQGKGVRFAENPEEPDKIHLSFRIIKYLIRHPVNRATLLRKNLEHVNELIANLHGYLKLAEQALNGSTVRPFTQDDLDVLGTAWELILKVSVLVSSVDSESNASLRRCFEWVSGVLTKTNGSLCEKTFELQLVMMNFSLNCALTSTSFEFMDSSLQMVMVDAFLAILKSLQNEDNVEKWRRSTHTLLKPISKLISSVASTTNSTTRILKHTLQYLNRNDEMIEDDSNCFVKSVTTALKNSRENTVFNPIFKTMKSLIKRLLETKASYHLEKTYSPNLLFGSMEISWHWLVVSKKLRALYKVQLFETY